MWHSSEIKHNTIHILYFIQSASQNISLTTVTVNVLKLRTLKIIIFSAVRNFRNYVSEKVLVFVILECGF